MTAVLCQAFPFIHPVIAAAALGTGLIPVFIHLINRRRHVRVPWAAMSFLIAASRRSAGRIRIERILLLLTRVLLIVLFGLAVARPYLPASVPLGGSLLSSSRVHRVILLDNSLSMNARTQSGSPTSDEMDHQHKGNRFELAKRCAEKLLDSFPPTDAVSLVTLAHPAEAVIFQASYDTRFVRERLAAISPTQRATDTAGALASAMEILGASEFAPGNRAVYLISDLPRRVWVGETAPSLRSGAASSESSDTPTGAVRALRQLVDVLTDHGDGPEGGHRGSPLLTVVRVAPGIGEPGKPGITNVGVTRLVSTSSLIGVNLPVRFSVEVTNFGSSPADDLALQVRRDGQIIRRQPLPRVKPRESTVVTITTEFSAPGTSLLEAKVSTPAGDALKEDDTRYLSVEVRRTTPVLLVDGRPGATLLAGEAGFLATALAPGLQVVRRPARLMHDQSTLIEPKVITEPELAGETLSDYDVVVLCNVPRLSAGTWKELETFVVSGGGLLIFAGDQLSVENYNRLGYAEGSGLLPGKFARHGEEVGRSEGREVGRSRGWKVDRAGETDTFIGFKVTDVPHPIVAEFAGHAESGLFSARVDRYLTMELDPRRAEVVLLYTNNDPAIVLATRGQKVERSKGQKVEGQNLRPSTFAPRGRVLICTTTANMDWTNLPAKGDFVPLVLSAVAYLSPPHGVHRNIMVGQPVHERLTPTELWTIGRKVKRSKGQKVERREEWTGGVAVSTFRHFDIGQLELVPDGDGFALEYGPVERAGAISVSIGSQVRTFAANVDPAESSLAVIGEREFVSVLDRPVHLVTITGRDADGTNGRNMADQPVAARSTELASIAVYLVLGLLLLEMWMAMRFGSKRSKG